MIRLELFNGDSIYVKQAWFSGQDVCFTRLDGKPDRIHRSMITGIKPN